MRLLGYGIRWWHIVLFCLAVALLTIGTSSLVIFYSHNSTELVIRVIDGDTIELSNGERVRYIGIDTPEVGEPYADSATIKNFEIVFGKEVRLEKDISDKDQYGRLLRYVYVDDLMVNAELVRLGYAKVKSYPPDTKYNYYFSELLKYARLSELGIWAPQEADTPITTPTEPERGLGPNPFK